MMMMMMPPVSATSHLLCFVLVLVSVAVAADVNELGQECYDIDSSWAIKSKNLSDTFGNKQALYDDFIEGCNEAVPENKRYNCRDDFRIKMNSDQPAGMRVRSIMPFDESDELACDLASHISCCCCLVELHAFGVQEN